MKMTEIREIAKRNHINPGKMKKQELVRTIQLKEGNFACFETAVTRCQQFDCCWRDDCQSEDHGG